MEELLAAVRAYVAANHPRRLAVRLRIDLDDGERIQMPIADVSASGEDVFVPTAFQLAILDALDGRALRTDALGAEVGDRGRLFRRPGGLPELREQGLVDNHPRLGYYRPDAPPPPLADTSEPDVT